MKGSPWKFSPYQISTEAPTGWTKDYKFGVWKNGTKLSTHNTYTEAYNEAMRLKNAPQS